jgi:hypothetical protein
MPDHRKAANHTSPTTLGKRRDYIPLCHSRRLALPLPNVTFCYLFGTAEPNIHTAETNRIPLIYISLGSSKTCISISMDLTRLEQIKTDLLRGDFLKHRRLLLGVGLATAVFWTVTFVGGYFLVTHAMDDNHITAQHGVNTPTDISSLFTNQRPYQLVNDLVFLNRVNVAPASDEVPNLLYASDQSGNKLLVVTESKAFSSEEKTANVMGTLRLITPQLLKKWKLSKDDQKAAKAQGIYLEAESLKAQKTPATMAKN